MGKRLVQLTDDVAATVANYGDPDVADGLIPYSALQVEHVEWLIPGLVPRGMLTVLAGEQGLGKSLLHARWAADLSRDGVSSVLVSAEDSPTHTTKARLHAAEAIQEIIYHAAILPVLGNGADPMWLDRMSKWILNTDARFLVLDPLAAFIDANSDSYKDQHVRRILSALDAVAQQTSCAIVYIMHLTKGTGANPLQRIQGSVAFTAAARSVLLMHPEHTPQEPTRILAHVKCNVAEKALPQRWEIEPILIPDLAGRDVRTARITYRGIAEGVDVYQMLAPREPEEPSGKVADAVDLMRSWLAFEDMPATELRTAMEQYGISQRTLERAKAELGTEPVKKGKVWHVRLSQITPPSQVRQGEDGGVENGSTKPEEFGF